MLKLKWLLPFLLLIITVSSTVAQQCLSIVSAALERAGDECVQTKRNEACYGYNQVIALPNVDPDTFKFDEHGDIAPIDQIEVMELSPFDEENEEWGIVIARVQAQLPDTLPGQNVTIVFFGGVSVENEGVNSEGIQAFRFETGIGRERCLGLPPDGILIETPEDSTVLTFDINGTEVTLGSTAFLQTFSEDDGSSDETMLRIAMVEGLGFISAQGQTTRITDGQQTVIPLDANLEAEGAPEPASDFDTGTLNIMTAFLEDLAFEDAETSAETQTTGLPCMVSTTEEASAGLRVGPGLNRTMRTWLIPNRQVTVTGISADGEWWQVDKYEAFPSGANSVVELWVHVDEVTATGDCDLISSADAPPIVAPPQGVTVSPTPRDAAPVSVITEEAQTPIIEIWTEDVDSSSATSTFETCTNINWYIEYVSAMYLIAPNSSPVPLAGITGSYQVCPHITTTYYIRIIYTDGGQEDFPVVVHRAG